MTSRRGGASLFYPILAAAIGAAFATGYTLRHNATPRLAVRPATQIAQAGGHLAYNPFAPENFLSPARPADGEMLRAAIGALGNSPPAGDGMERSRRTFDTVYNLVRQYYVDRLPSDRKMSYGAIRSMLSSLNDPNCYFLEPEQYALLEAEAQGRYPGIGISFNVRPQKRDGYTEHKIVVVSALPNSPAANAGLKSGDVITHIDGKWVLGYDPFLQANKLAAKLDSPIASQEDEAAFRKEADSARKRFSGGISLFAAQMALRGDRKTITDCKLPTEKRVLTIERSGVKEPLTIEMVPNATEVASLEVKTLATGESYIRVPAFTTKTAAEFKHALEGLPKNGGLVLDLRGNAGGVLDAALEVEGLLTPAGVRGAFVQQIAFGGKQIPVKAKDGKASRRPIAVLVNNGTASVAEALAASLADKGIATLVGGKTFGDGMMQAAYTLPDGAAFVLTVGKMISPSKHTDWSGIGLIPEVQIAATLGEEQVLARAVEALKHRSQVAEYNREVK